ncbi:MAG TPA: endonuclease [Phycisphaerae bacterium]|nr:endonuclease [Phycisphaerae bacterium]
MAKGTVYDQIVESVFLSRYRKGAREVPFGREEISRVAKELGLDVPKNLGDVVYSYRYRKQLPRAVRDRAPEGKQWVIRAAGTSRYCFAAVDIVNIIPSEALAETKIPDATPGLISMYALADEQALLAKLRYNRLLDIFLGVACYSLQSHLRTAVPGLGQVETDELYVGIARSGVHYVFPVQAKGRRDRISTIQVKQDLAMCKHKFPALVCRAVAVQFVHDDLIALFALEETRKGIRVALERHYLLVLPEDLSKEELEAYGRRRPETELGL